MLSYPVCLFFFVKLLCIFHHQRQSCQMTMEIFNFLKKKKFSAISLSRIVAVFGILADEIYSRSALDAHESRGLTAVTCQKLKIKCQDTYDVRNAEKL